MIVESIEAIGILLDDPKWRDISLNVLIVICSGLGIRAGMRMVMYRSLETVGQQISENKKSKIQERSRYWAIPTQLITSFLATLINGMSWSNTMIVISGVEISVRSTSLIFFITEWQLLAWGSVACYVIIFSLLLAFQKKYKIEIVRLWRTNTKKQTNKD